MPSPDLSDQAPNLVSLVTKVSVTWASFLLFKQAKCVPSSRTTHLLFPLPPILSPRFSPGWVASGIQVTPCWGLSGAPSLKNYRQPPAPPPSVQSFSLYPMNLYFPMRFVFFITLITSRNNHLCLLVSYCHLPTWDRKIHEIDQGHCPHRRVQFILIE